jgi:iron complex outermembrane receptor protein
LVGSYTNVSSQTFGTRKGENGALFVQLDKKFFNRLTISIGERNEIIHLDTLKPVVVPIVRAGINYQAAEATFIRASFGQGYRYPSIAEKYVTTVRSGINVIPNPDVKAESGWSGEIGVKQGFKIAKSWQGFLDLAGFVTQYQNMIEFNAVEDADGRTAYQANNVTNARISGFEVSGLGQGKIMGYPVNFMIGYTYLNPIDLGWKDTVGSTKSNILKYRFRHSAKADCETTIKHVIIGFTATYTSFMENIDPYIEGPNLNGIRSFRDAHHGGNFVLDGRVGYSLSDETRISFIAKNVLNKQYSLRPGYMEAPRNYTVQLSYQF